MIIHISKLWKRGKYTQIEKIKTTLLWSWELLTKKISVYLLWYTEKCTFPVLNQFLQEN